MIEAQAIETLADIAVTASTFFSIFISVTFAYLTVAYLVGRDLTRIQLVVVDTMYIISASIMGSSMYIWNEAWLEVHNREATVFSDSWLLRVMPWEGSLAILLLTMVIASLYFMHDIRRRDRKIDKAKMRDVHT